MAVRGVTVTTGAIGATIINSSPPAPEEATAFTFFIVDILLTQGLTDETNQENQ